MIAVLWSFIALLEAVALDRYEDSWVSKGMIVISIIGFASLTMLAVSRSKWHE